jgi:hypothetical protein
VGSARGKHVDRGDLGVNEDCGAATRKAATRLSPMALSEVYELEEEETGLRSAKGREGRTPVEDGLGLSHEFPLEVVLYGGGRMRISLDIDENTDSLHNFEEPQRSPYLRTAASLCHVLLLTLLHGGSWRQLGRNLDWAGRVRHVARSTEQ